MRLLRILLLAAACVAAKLPVGSFLNEAELQLKILDYITQLDAENFELSHRSLAVYHLGLTSHEDSIDVAENNVKLFMSAVQQHTANSTYRAFYVFNVVGAGANPLYAHCLPDLPNIAYRKGYHHPLGDVMTLIQTVGALNEAILGKFGLVLYMHSGARGPFLDRQNGEWWRYFIEPMVENPAIGLLGPTISCDGTPHIQSYTLACKPDVALTLAKDVNLKKATRKRNLAVNLQQMVTNGAINLGYKIASFYDRRVRGIKVFDGTCGNGTGNSVYFLPNPTSWCESTPENLLFMRWGGAPMRIRGYYCQDVIDRVRARTVEIAYAERLTEYVLPETMYGTPWYSTMKDYDLESWRDRSVVLQPLRTRSHGGHVHPKKICFVVRTSMAHGDKATAQSRVVPMNLRLFIATLLRQSNPNWEAYFIVTDDQPFDDELQTILGSYDDYRLNYLPLDMKFRPKYDPVEAGYPASDEAMRIVLDKPQCAWVSVTNGDNAYGSEVINAVLSLSGDQKKDIVVMPMDSRNFANEVYQSARIRRGGYTGWQEHCGDFEERILREPLGFARQSRLNVGGVDIAAMFIDRTKFLKTNISFNHYAHADEKCVGCQDGLWADHMVHQHAWSHVIMPLVDLRTIVFHGPSPLWCIAGGHVWLDHPRHTECLSHRMVGTLQDHPAFDMARFHTTGKRTCLRLSEAGFAQMDTSRETFFS